MSKSNNIMKCKYTIEYGDKREDACMLDKYRVNGSPAKCKDIKVCEYREVSE